MVDETALEQELRDTRERLHQALIALEKAREETKLSLRKASEFKQIADNQKLQLDATSLQLEKLAQRKTHMVDADILVQQLLTAQDKQEAAERHVQVLLAVRDASANRINELRSKVFDLENGLDRRMAAAEGEALFYKRRLTELIQSLQDTMINAGLALKPAEVAQKL